MLKWSTSTKLITYILLIPLIIRSCSSETGQSTPNPDQTKQSSPPNVKLDSVYVELGQSYNEFTFSYDHPNKVRVFTANKGYGFNKVVGKGGGCFWFCWCDTKTIWEGAKDKKEYATKVENKDLGSGKKAVTIHLAEGGTKIYKREKRSGNWIEDVTNQKSETKSSDNSGQDNSNALKPVELIFNKNQESQRYSYSSNNKVATFEANQGYGFSKLKQSPSCPWLKYLFCYCMFSCCFSYGWFEDKTIWKAESESQYATKVTYNSKDDKLEMTLADKSTKLLEKKGSFYNKQWTEVAPTEPPKNQNLKANE